MGRRTPPPSGARRRPMNRRLRLLIHRSESNTREIARGGLINAGSAGLGALASFALLVVVTRGTSLVETGLFFQALALATAASLVTSLGASTSMTRTVAGIPRHQDQDASTAIWAGLLPVGISTTLVGVAGAVDGRHLGEPPDQCATPDGTRSPDRPHDACRAPHGRHPLLLRGVEGSGRAAGRSLVRPGRTTDPAIGHRMPSSSSRTEVTRPWA